jgi:hypothetical protein
MFNDSLDASERAALDAACREAHEAFGPAFEQWRRRVDAGEVAPIQVSWPLSVAVPDNIVVGGKCASRRAEFAELGKQAALAAQRQGRDAYLELSDDPDELLGQEMYSWYVKYRARRATQS